MDSNGWQPISDAPKGRKIIVGYRNRLGLWRSVFATYYLAGTLDTEDGAVADENGFAPEGWYEESETHETLYPVDEHPIMWMEAPPEPAR